jgi:hypothetical protein
MLGGEAGIAEEDLRILLLEREYDEAHGSVGSRKVDRW